jgi:hypothetical protein
MLKRNIPSDGDKGINVILDGTKLMGLYYRNVCFKDSSLFLPMRLEKLPACFNLLELKKGFFCHGFNKIENQNYIGEIPPKEDFGFDYFTPQKREEFLIWYEQEKHKPYNFKENFEAYCASDVDILSKACQIFSKTSRACSSMDELDKGECPFRESLTLASYCNLIYRRNYMPENSISRLPNCGYNPKANLSHKCELWLKYLAETNKIRIQHAKNGGEYKILDYYVDGFCEEKKMIFEMQGCKLNFFFNYKIEFA